MGACVDPNELMADDAAEGAATGLLALMAGLSEEHWAAGWISGNEFGLWRMVQGGENRRMGMGEVTERQVQLLKLLSDECNGWWTWDEVKGPVFVNITEWFLRCQALNAEKRRHPEG